MPHRLPADLNLLVALDQLLEHRHVTRAARALSLSQSAMSHKLRQLREHFGDELLVRTGSGMVLTERAEALRDPLRAAMTSLRSALQHGVAFDPATSTRHFTIGTADYGEFAIIPRMLETVVRDAPYITAQTVPTPRPPAAALERGMIDLVIGGYMEPSAALRRRKLFDEGFVVVARRGHPALADVGPGTPIPMGIFCDLRHLQITPQGREGGPIDAMLAARGASRTVTIRVSGFTPAPFIAASTDLVLTCPEQLVVAAQEYADFAVYDLPFPSPRYDVLMFWHERHHADAGHQWLRKAIVAVHAERGQLDAQ